MEFIADTVIQIAQAFKNESLISQILFMGALIGLPLWFLRLARASLRQERSKALDDLDEIARDFDDLKARHEEIRAELEVAKKSDPETLLAEITPQRRDENMQKVRETSQAYLDATAQAQGAAHVIMTEFHLGRGRRELDEALRHSRGAVAAIPRDATARGLLSTVTGRIGEVRKEPETEEERAAEAEETRLAAIIADDEVDAMTLFRVAEAEFQRGWYRIAAAIWERALTIAAAEDGSSSPFALQLRLRIALAMLWAGELSKAERLARPLPAAFEAAHSSNASETLSAKHLCAEVDLNLGRAAEAEDQFRAVSSLQKILLGDEDEDVLTTSFYIARALLDQGKAAEAEAVLRSILPVYQRVSGAEHPATLWTKFYVARAQLDQGKSLEAEAAWRDLLPVWERTSGAEHPNTLTTSYSVAGALLYQNKAAEAEALLRDLLPLRERVSGAEHPDTLMMRSTIARALLGQSKASEAEAVWRDLLPLRERLLGSEHPDVLRTRSSIADALLDQGKALEAEALWRDLLPLQTRVIGAEHPDTLVTRSSIADALLDQGKASEAEAAWRDLLPLQTSVRGAEHPKTLMNRFYIARALLDRGKASEAEAGWRDLLPVWERVGGADHPETLSTRFSLARAMFAEGRFREAYDLLGELAIVIARTTAATDHRLGDIAFLRAQCADALGDRIAAEGFLAEADANCRDRLTPEHPFRRELVAYLANRNQPTTS